MGLCDSEARKPRGPDKGTPVPPKPASLLSPMYKLRLGTGFTNKSHRGAALTHLQQSPRQTH